MPQLTASSVPKLPLLTSAPLVATVKIRKGLQVDSAANVCLCQDASESFILLSSRQIQYWSQEALRDYGACQRVAKVHHGFHHLRAKAK